MSTIADFVVNIRPDLRAFNAAMRSVVRSVHQMQRNQATRPVSAERKEIQRIGRDEMAAAIAWFNDHLSAAAIRDELTGQDTSEETA